MTPRIFIALLLFTPSLYAGVVQDQAVIGFWGERILPLGGPDSDRLAQTVVAGRAGDLSHIDLVIGCTPDSPGDVTVDLQGVDADGLPDGVSLGRAALPAASLPEDPIFFREFPFSGVRLDVGQPFAIVMSAERDADCSSRRGSTPGGFFPYPDGAGFEASDDSDWQPLEGDADLPFITWMAFDDNFCAFKSADGTPNDWLSDDVPVCRCLSDALLSRHRCSFEFGDFHLWREIPAPFDRPDLTAVWHVVAKSPGFSGLVVSETSLTDGAGTKFAFDSQLPMNEVSSQKVTYKGGIGVQNEVRVRFFTENGPVRYRFVTTVASPEKP